MNTYKPKKHVRSMDSFPVFHRLWNYYLPRSVYLIRLFCHTVFICVTWEWNRRNHITYCYFVFKLQITLCFAPNVLSRACTWVSLQFILPALHFGKGNSKNNLKLKVSQSLNMIRMSQELNALLLIFMLCSLY